MEDGVIEWFNDESISVGTEIRIMMGYKNAVQEMIVGDITAGDLSRRIGGNILGGQNSGDAFGDKKLVF